MEKNTNLGIVVGIILVSLITFINNKTPFLYSAQGSIQEFFSSPKNVFYNLVSGKDSDIDEIKKENKKILSRLIDYENLKKDNEALRSQFENSSIPLENLIPVRVIGMQGRVSNPDKLIIDKGEDDGVVVGASVVFEKNLVGKIINVSKKYSVMILPLHKDFSTVGKTLEGQAQGIIQGQDDLILFNRVLITDKLEERDLLLTKGDMREDGVGILGDLVVGKIIVVNKSDSKPFQEAQVKSLVDYSKLNLVFVIGRM